MVGHYQLIICLQIVVELTEMINIAITNHAASTKLLPLFVQKLENINAYCSHASVN